MTAVIYARYSSDNQREESIEGQIRECTAYAEKNGFYILDTYIDRALSAKTDNRPQFQKMIQDSSQKLFDVILVWKLDRFARNRYDSAHYKNVLKKNNVKVVSATETISHGAEGILLESMLEGMAEYYSAELSEKINRGLTENALKSKYNGGTRPIGYVINSERRFAIDPQTAPIVLEAFKLYASGKTIKEVMDIVNNKGLRTTRGGKLSFSAVNRMLQNRSYIGEYHYSGIVNENGVPQIVPKELFDKVQKTLIKNKKAPARHKAKDDYLLTTKIFCGNCGSMMVGEIGTGRNNQQYRYYKCIGAKRRKGCDRKKGIKKDVIENLVLSYVIRLIMNDEIVEKIIDLAMADQQKENIALPALQKQLSDINRSIENMLNAIQDGIYTPSTKERLTSLENSREELEILIAKEQISKPIISRNQFRYWLHELRNLNIEHLESRKCLVNTFVNSVVVYEDKIELVFNYREGTETVPFNTLKTVSDFSMVTPPKTSVHFCVRKFFIKLRDLKRAIAQAIETVRGDCFGARVRAVVR